MYQQQVAVGAHRCFWPLTAVPYSSPAAVWRTGEKTVVLPPSPQLSCMLVSMGSITLWAQEMTDMKKTMLSFYGRIAIVAVFVAGARLLMDYLIGQAPSFQKPIEFVISAVFGIGAAIYISLPLIRSKSRDK